MYSNQPEIEARPTGKDASLCLVNSAALRDVGISLGDTVISAPKKLRREQIGILRTPSRIYIGRAAGRYFYSVTGQLVEIAPGDRTEWIIGIEKLTGGTA